MSNRSDRYDELVDKALNYEDHDPRAVYWMIRASARGVYDHYLRAETDRSDDDLVTDGSAPTGELEQMQDVEQRLDLACQLVVNTHPDAHLSGMIATIRTYRDFIRSNIQEAGGVDAPTFVSWMDSAERNPDEFPEPWGARLVELFDGVLIRAVRDDNIPVPTVVDGLDEWTENTTREIERAHDLGEGYFDDLERSGGGGDE